MVSQLLQTVAFAATAAAMAINTTLIEARDGPQYCFSVDAADKNWYYAMAGGPWGSASGTFGSTNGQICVPRSDGAGGAMYIGPFANPGPGSTKLECQFPLSGQAYCDISLVDGYSLSMTCGAGGQGGPIFGGGGDFYSQGNPCPDASGPNCLNQNGYAASQSDVAEFFQYGVQNGNDYCIWKNCNIPNFPVDTSMGCYITGF